MAIRENLISDYWISLTYIESSDDEKQKIMKNQNENNFAE